MSVGLLVLSETGSLAAWAAMHRIGDDQGEKAPGQDLLDGEPERIVGGELHLAEFTVRTARP